MMTVLAFATPMELFFSEVWLIYEYQRDLMPLYVPVGHWFLYDLGRRLSTHMTERAALPSILILLPLVALRSLPWHGYVSRRADGRGHRVRGPRPRAALVRHDGLVCARHGALGHMVGSMEMGGGRAMDESHGLEPPLLVGGFYALGDLLVNLTVRWLGPQEADGPVMTSDAVDAA